MLLKIDKLCKSYGKKNVLKDVSFEVEEGQMVALLGVNGAGKTTLFRCLSRLALIDSGSIQVDSNKIKRKQDILYVFDEPVLYETLTGEEQLRFVLDINDIKLEKKEIDELIEKFQITSFRNKKIEEYSLGMKKKVQLMCAIAIKPKILLLDEYVSGLDPISLKQVENILKEYVAAGNTVILSTHILDIAERLCEYVLFMQDGIVGDTIMDINVVKNKYDSLEEYYFAMANK